MVNAQRTTIEVWKHVEGLRNTKQIAGVARGNGTKGKGAGQKNEGGGCRQSLLWVKSG